MSVIVILEAHVKPETIDNFKTNLKDLLVDTRNYDGCEKLLVNINQDDPLNIVIVERWETRQQYEKYLGWREETGVLAEFGEALTEPPNIRFFDETDI